MGISGQTIHGSDEQGGIVMEVDKETKIWKGRWGVGIDSVQAGDEFAAVIRPILGGKYKIKEIYLNIVNY